ncbi:hypothetical protein [Gelidibacter pelagius]|uniref:Uncharacterized protein n=1 Tax=Gelidibacter pelagius TaxID=2819985 RepID=A0ABS3SPH9_9FLAO|nr:hypothetical protein [Gelidibacter pelagius]MBO3097620.1 hypothetical protein [Gelidibacter pelagius]
MDYTFFLLLLFILITFFHSGLLVKNVWGSIISFKSPDNKEAEINISPGHSKRRDFIRTIISIPFLIAPILLYNLYAEFKFDNVSSHNVVLIIFIILAGYFTYVHHYKLWSDKFKEDFNPSNPLGILYDKISNNKDILKKEIQSTKEELVKTSENTHKIEKEVEDLKKKTIVKPRESQKRQQRIDKIEAGFKLFISELESFPDYNAKEKTIDYKKFELTELQSYQTLVEFFKRNYDVPQDKTYSAMFRIFNSHFNIKERDLHSNNWQDFNIRLLPDIENNYLFNDLSLIRNKSTQQLSDSSKRHI